MSSKQEPMSTSVPRKVAVTSSRMSSKTKTRTSSKCSLITEAFGKSTWSRKSDNYENAKSVISSYATHMKSSCKCVPDVGLQYLTGNAYFELFLSKLKRVQKKVAEIEAEHIDEDHLKPSSPCDEDIRENPSLDHVSESHKPSKLDSLALQNIVNLNTHRKLLVSLSEALKFWTHAAYSSSYRDYDLAKLRVSEYLTTACYVFRCYRLNDCLESCSLMLVKLGEPTDCMTGYCLLTNLYMDLGRIQEATNAMSKAAQLEKELMLQCMESYELYLFKLTKCEYDLVTGTSVKDAGRRLHEIIHSPYLQKLTLNRYYLKGIALLLATKFHFEDYSYSTDHQEFIEPIQVSICLVKRWHRNLFDPVSGTKGNEGVGDPEWLKFASYSMLLKAYEVISVFSRGCGQPVELLFYHNPLIRLCRQNCFIYWVQRLLLIGSEVDEMTDKLRCRAMKLHNALEVTAKQSRLDIAVKKRSKPISKSQVDEVDVEDDFRLSSIETERGGMVSCLHEANFIPWQVKRQAMNVKDSDDDDVFGNDYSLPIFKSSSEGIAGLEISHMSISLQMLTSKDTNFLQRLTESKSPFADFGNAVGINVSLVNQVSSEWFEAKAKFVLVLLRHLIEKGQYKSSLSFIKTLFSKNYSYIENYSNRVLLVTVISRYLEVSLKISSEKIKSVVYNACEIEDAAIFGGSRKNSLNSSPAVSSMKLQSKIQAPKKQPYKMDLLQEYYAAQSEELLKVIKGVPSPLSKLLPTKKSLKSSRTAKSIDFVNEAGGDSPKITRQSRRIKSNIENFTYHSGRAELSRNKSSSDFIEPLPFSDFRIKPNPVEKLISEFEQLEMSGTSENAAIRAMKALDGSSSNKLRDSLSYLLHNYLGNHPPANLYTKLCSLLSDVYNLKENFSKRLSGYYFAESATCASLRYRCIRISEKKQRRKMKMKLPVKDLMYRDFKCKATRLEELLAPLPENWRVTQISAINFKGKRQIPDLKLVRYERGKKPLSLTIIGSSDKFVIDFMDELTEIIQLSNGSIINKDATTFWKVRYALDDRLKVLLNGVELSWFGPFKGFFLGKVEDPVYYEMVSAAQNRVLKESSSRKLVCSDPDLLNLVIESYPLLSKDELRAGLGKIFSNFTHDFLRRCLDIVDEEFTTCYPIDDKLSVLSSLKKAPLGLVLNTHLEPFPFESLPSFLTIKQDVFRVPSLLFLSLMLKTFKDSPVMTFGASEQDTFYLLNPADNLGKTEEMFKSRFENEKRWAGVVGRKPEPEELANALQSKEVYIFFGHGAGTSYYRTMPDNLEGLTVNTAALVIGCSSGRLTADGSSLESYGTPYRFLVNGAPCYVGVLWDVTDRDIDKFSDRMLENWLPSWQKEKGSKSIAYSCTEARSACKLKYLIGAAPVVYGLPVHAFSKNSTK